MHPLVHLGPLILPTYYLLISLGSLSGVIWFLKRTPADQEGAAIHLAFVVLSAGFVGARLLHVLFEAPQIYIKDPLLIIEFWYGGFVFYGGLIGGLLGGFWYIKEHGFNWALWCDRACLPAGLAYAIGRIGCFFNGCCYGKVCELPWATRFPVHAFWGLAVLPRHPTQLYASVLEFANLAVMLLLERKKVFRNNGELFCCWLAIHAINRVIVEHWRDDDRGAMIGGLSLSTIISLILLAYALKEWRRYRSCKNSCQTQ